MQEITDILQPLRSANAPAGSKSRLRDLGYISCTNTVDIKHVPFYEPCAILVLAGTKTIYDHGRTVTATAGSLLTVPAPGSVDLRNAPDPKARKYEALIVPFTTRLLDQLIRSHGFLHEVKQGDVAVLKFEPDDTLHRSIAHYLTTASDAKLRNHRLMEILLILASHNPRLLSYALQQPGWSERVRAVLSRDLAHPWEVAEVCQRLAVSESTLRRNLRAEDTSFRALLHELRLSASLVQLLQTSLPIYRIALDCGYQSVSRFTRNFHDRFGLPPRRFRENMDEAERNLTASGQPAS
jgi:AraC-like DNA-binding protein